MLNRVDNRILKIFISNADQVADWKKKERNQDKTDLKYVDENIHVNKSNLKSFCLLGKLLLGARLYNACWKDI